jgi:hypothetical protein
MNSHLYFMVGQQRVPPHSPLFHLEHGPPPPKIFRKIRKILTPDFGWNELSGNRFRLKLAKTHFHIFHILMR